jgi:uncharacterized protein with HEPN domain
MRQPDDRLLVADMLEQARLAIGAIEQKTRMDFESDRLLQAAAQRFLEVIGEAASRVSDQTRNLLPGVPWREIIGMRNRLIHGYSSVDNDIVWETIKGDLPTIVDALSGFSV